MPNLLVGHDEWQRRFNGQCDDLQEMFGVTNAYFVYYFWLINQADEAPREADQIEQREAA